MSHHSSGRDGNGPQDPVWPFNEDDNAPIDDFESSADHGAEEDETTGAVTTRKRRRIRIAVIAAAVVVVLVGGTAAGYVLYLNHILNRNITHEALVPKPGDPLVDSDGNAITGEDGEAVTATPPPERDPDAGDALNFLVIGSDSRDLSVDRGRADVIMLMHVSSDRESVHLVHFPRDLFVEIPGQSRMNKINASYAYGGAPLLIQTLQPLVGVPIDHVVMVNFDSFREMTDAIGGVEVNVAESSPGFPAGTMHMDGDTGLDFVRERYTLSQGDITRGQRQQAFIKAVMLKGLSGDTLTNPVRLANFVDAATANLIVDEELEVGDMRSLAFSMRNIRGGDIEFVTAPWSGIGSDDFAGSTVLPHDEQFQVLRRHLSNDTMDDYVDDVSPRSGWG